MFETKNKSMSMNLCTVYVDVSENAIILYLQPTEDKGFKYITYYLFSIVQYDLPPLRPHCGEARAEIRTRDGWSKGRDTNH